jgi:hypothetical protein
MVAVYALLLSIWFRSLVEICADDSETPVTCARNLRDFQGECSSFHSLSLH